VEDQIDDGSPVGGFALALGMVALGLALAHIPIAIWLDAGWIAGCMVWLAAPAALLAAGMALVMEESPRGRSNARRAIILGLLALFLQVVLAISSNLGVLG